MEPLTVLEIEHDEHIAILWLNRPEARNAMAPQFFEELPRAMEMLSSDRDVRVVIVAARGEHFSVGLDLKAAASGGLIATNDASMAARAALTRETVLRLQGAISSVAQCPKPVIAVIHGYCIGGGLDLACACDIRIASEDATISLRETRMAMVADLGSLQRLPYIIARGHLAEMAFTGEDVPAIRAREIGLVNDIFADADEALSASRRLAARIAANSPLAVQGAKAVISRRETGEVTEGLDYVATWNAGFLASDDLMEAMAAFIEKRDTHFSGS
ncbi:MAG: crotonase/enoyl-CoA hydratase family protein [Acidimicrobiales bacterium]